MDEGLSDTNSPVKKPVAGDDDDDDDFLMPATGRVRNRGAILDDENSQGERKNHKLAGQRQCCLLQTIRVCVGIFQKIIPSFC